MIERTHAGLARSRANGIKTGRREALSAKKQAEVVEQLAKQVSVSQLARDFGTTRQTILRIRKKAESTPLETSNPGLGHRTANGMPEVHDTP
ncbi:helix-turn-helix domain-containing protein [Pseudomonas sp. NPDC098747]|uniref:helix-turn-helix domain-containing protein n=1 Tax=Pseudomonas sp. NPDC098747 TaxID=3364487 RepID=UPI00383B46E2